MTKITYVPRSTDDPHETVVAGIAFVAHEPVDVQNPVIAEKLAANPWFTDADAPAAPVESKRAELEHELEEIQHEIDELPKSE